jgi:hypothetical protein
MPFMLERFRWFTLSYISSYVPPVKHVFCFYLELIAESGKEGDGRNFLKIPKEDYLQL